MTLFISYFFQKIFSIVIQRRWHAYTILVEGPIRLRSGVFLIIIGHCPYIPCFLIQSQSQMKGKLEEVSCQKLHDSWCFHHLRQYTKVYGLGLGEKGGGIFCSSWYTESVSNAVISISSIFLEFDHDHCGMRYESVHSRKQHNIKSHTSGYTPHSLASAHIAHMCALSTQAKKSCNTQHAQYTVHCVTSASHIPNILKWDACSAHISLKFSDSMLTSSNKTHTYLELTHTVHCVTSASHIPYISKFKVQCMFSTH